MVAGNVAEEPSWPLPLQSRIGAFDRLAGIRVFHDFRWRDVFPDERCQFRNGRALAWMLKQACPLGKEPSLLLTTLTDAPEGHVEHPLYHLLVINIEQYLKTAKPNAAAAYIGRLGGVDPIRSSGLRLDAARTDELLAFLRAQTSPDFIRSWLSVDPARLEALAAVLRSHEGGLQAVVTGVESEAARHLMTLLGDEAWSALSEAGIELPTALAHQRIWSERRRDCTEFRYNLEHGNWREPEWQGFFERRTWIFGFSLRYQFLHHLQSRPNVGGRDLRRQGGQEADFLVRSEAAQRFTALVEIKTPQAELVSTTPYRNRTHAPGADLAGGVAQVQQECHRWTRDAQMVENQDLLESEHTWTHNPRGILVIGNLATLEGSRDRLYSFESFRRNLRLPEVVTFDELLARAEQMVELGEAESLASPETSATPTG